MGKKLTFVKVAALAAVISGFVFAQDEAVVISTPASWTTLRSDSLIVTVQADTSRLPKGTIDFKVIKHTGKRTSALFTKKVKMEDYNADVFLGTIKDKNLGGADFLSIEWSVAGSDLSGKIEPFGKSLINEAAQADKKSFSAVKLGDGLSAEQISAELAGAQNQDIGGSKITAGWNNGGLYILFDAAASAEQAQFAFDPKCGRSAFLSWADRFVLYTPAAQELKGIHYKRSVDKNAVKYTEMQWGEGEGVSLSGSENSKLIKIQWHEMGLQPFEERNIGFAVFINEKSKKGLSYPLAANREIPGTWGELKLEK